MDSSSDSDTNFFKHVFNFDDDSKSDILNILQYSLLAVSPVIMLNKAMSKYIPDGDDKKGSLEIGAEIVIQIVVIFMGLLLIHRIITFIPTYSGEKYPDFKIIYVVLAILMITLSLQTKLGEKGNILVERIVDLWEGNTDKRKKNVKNGSSVRVSQPIAGSQMITAAAIARPQYSDGTSISDLPISDVGYSGGSSSSVQQTPNYNNMYQNTTTPLVDAATPGGMEAFVPMAANAVLGGGFGSAW
jgi:hypothetical protein